MDPKLFLYSPIIFRMNQYQKTSTAQWKVFWSDPIFFWPDKVILVLLFWTYSRREQKCIHIIFHITQIITISSCDPSWSSPRGSPSESRWSRGWNSKSSATTWGVHSEPELKILFKKVMGKNKYFKPRFDEFFHIRFSIFDIF